VLATNIQPSDDQDDPEAASDVVVPVVTTIAAFFVIAALILARRHVKKQPASKANSAKDNSPREPQFSLVMVPLGTKRGDGPVYGRDGTSEVGAINPRTGQFEPSSPSYNSENPIASPIARIDRYRLM
jgi:hypothetical protein